jgi:hypothetical protein
MAEVLRGIVGGRKIELVDGPELADGQRVQVMIEARPVPIGPESPGPTAVEGVVHIPATPALASLLERIRRDRPPLPPSPSGPNRGSAAGMLADDPELDLIMAEVERQRRSDYGRADLE